MAQRILSFTLNGKRHDGVVRRVRITIDDRPSSLAGRPLLWGWSLDPTTKSEKHRRDTQKCE